MNYPLPNSRVHYGNDEFETQLNLIIIKAYFMM